MSITQHLDFALLDQEVKICAICKQARSNEVGTEKVTPGGIHSVGGYIAFCPDCWGHDHYWLDGDDRTNAKREQLIAQWRPTAPPCIQVIKGKPVQLIVRGKCDDQKLADVIESTFGKVPDESRKKIMDYLLSLHSFTVTGVGMRFEALGRWPGMGATVGMNMDRGHAIRLRASYVNECMRHEDIDDLIHTIAHELAHTEQMADDKSFETDDECERDVESRLLDWGFGSGLSMEKRETMLAHIDLVIREAKSARKEVTKCSPPSGNYLNDAISQAERAVNNIRRATDRWRGR
jgi:predicted Zn-dependent protease with MMP-like domain